MAFRVFLSYSLDPGEQALAWRLQTLAAAHGVDAYVPRRLHYQSAQSSYDSAKQAVRREMERSDCVLGLITNLSRETRRALEGELNGALRLKKLVIPIVEASLQDDKLIGRLAKAHVPSFVFSPEEDGGEVERGVAKLLSKRKASEEERRAVGGLVALAVGLLLLSAVSNE